MTMLQCYVLDKGPGCDQISACDMASVKQTVRTIHRDMRDDVRVKLVQFVANKESIVGMRNGVPPEDKVLRKWRLGSRGGKLIEIKPEDD
jgi:hypothetical protein